MKESRELRFKRLAEARVNKLLHDIRVLGNLSNRANYSYSPEQIRKIFRVINSNLEWVELRFKDGKPAKFSLEDMVKKVGKIKKVSIITPKPKLKKLTAPTAPKIEKKVKVEKVKITFEPKVGKCNICKANRMTSYYRGLWICKLDWRKRKSFWKLQNHIKEKNNAR